MHPLKEGAIEGHDRVHEDRPNTADNHFEKNVQRKRNMVAVDVHCSPFWSVTGTESSERRAKSACPIMFAGTGTGMRFRPLTGAGQGTKIHMTFRVARKRSDRGDPTRTGIISLADWRSFRLSYAPINFRHRFDHRRVLPLR